MRKLLDVTTFILFTYPVGIVIGTTFELLGFVGIVEIVGRKNFPKQRGKIVLVSNHPSLLEPVLLIGLFFRQYALWPKYSLWTLTDKWWYNILVFFLVHPRLIPVDRPRYMGKSESLAAAKQVLSSGGNIIIFSEGSRTFNGAHHLFSGRGKRILPLRKGIAVLADEPQAVTVPVWVEFSEWRRVKINIGTPMHFEGRPREEVIEQTTKALLALADATY